MYIIAAWAWDTNLDGVHNHIVDILPAGGCDRVVSLILISNKYTGYSSYDVLDFKRHSGNYKLISRVEWEQLYGEIRYV